jgi:hypothetical protein
MASGIDPGILPLLLMAIGLITVVIYAARHQIGVNSVYKNVQRLGNLTNSGQLYPGVHGIIKGRKFNCYYKNVKSESISFLMTIFIGRKVDAELDPNIILSLGLKNSNVYTMALRKRYFDIRYLPKELQERQIWHLMNRIGSYKDFKHFVKLSIGTDAIRYHHHFTGMKMNYIQDIIALLILIAERVEKIGPVFRIKGFDY